MVTRKTNNHISTETAPEQLRAMCGCQPTITLPGKLILTAALLSSLGSPYASANDDIELLDLQLEDLLNVQVTSASKKQESLNTVASAMYVISNGEIRRSGATNIPDILRTVPGIQVARIDSNKWAISSRGFNGRFSNKLLVMIDGRTVYSPSYSGVYWEMQDVRLEDIERIEVIRGPGGSVWGANAVNGVINIISKHAADTLGNQISAGTGNYEKAMLNGRVGAKLSENTYGRININANQRGESTKPDGSDSNDAWDTYRLGARLDTQLNSTNNISLVADYTDGDIDQDTLYAIYSAPYQAINSGDVTQQSWSIISRWDHTISNTSDLTLQLYVDHFERKEFAYDEERGSYDLDFTHRFLLTDTHNLSWGLGYRQMNDDIQSSDIIVVAPPSRRNELASAFAQDQIALSDTLSLTLGVKWERNDYTGEEIQPSLKMSWKASASTQLWASVAKAVRTPSIQEVDAELLVRSVPCSSIPDQICPPGDPTIVNSSVATSTLSSEELSAYEFGLRSQLSPTSNIDLALFYNDYNNLRSYYLEDPVFRPEPEPHIFVGASLTNASEGNNYGVELASSWAPIDTLLFNLSYTYIRTNINWANYIDVNQNTPAPRHQLALQSSYKVAPNVETNLTIRYVDNAAVISGFEPGEIDAYSTVDFNIAWQVTPSTEFRIVGQNLLDSSHPEYIQEFLIAPTEVERSIYGKVTVDF